MDLLENFYLKIIANLKNLQTVRMSSEKLLPLKFELFEKRKDFWKARKLSKKSEKQRKQIENGYYKGIADALKLVNKIFKVYEKECSKE